MFKALQNAGSLWYYVLFRSFHVFLSFLFFSLLDAWLACIIITHVSRDVITFRPDLQLSSIFQVDLSQDV